MNDNEVTFKVWLIGVPEPFVFALSQHEAARTQAEIEVRIQPERPIGSIRMGNGTLIRSAAIAATRIVPPDESRAWVMR